MKDDAELLRCYVVDRSDLAFTELVQRHIGRVYAIALRRVGGDTHLAEDVTQKVFTDLARKAASLITRPCVASWLHVSAHHASAAVVRSEQRRKSREAQGHFMHATSDPAADATLLRPLLDDVIVDLKEEDRAALMLRFFERRSFTEVGQALRITEEAARKRVDRALEKLRTLLTRRGVTSTAAALGIALAAANTGVVSPTLTAKIAGHALAQATASTGTLSAILSTLKTIGPIATVLGVGAILIDHQWIRNHELAAELARLDGVTHDITTLRQENGRLGRLIAQDNNLLRSQTELPREVTPLLESAPPPAPIAATITLSAAGIIRWGEDAVNLREFLARLQTLRAQSSDTEPRITLLASATANADAVRYVVEEARKAQVGLSIISDDPLASASHGWWFKSL